MSASSPPPPPDPSHFGKTGGCSSSGSPRPAIRRAKTVPNSLWRREPLLDVTNQVVGDRRLQRVPNPFTLPSFLSAIPTSNAGSTFASTSQQPHNQIGNLQPRLRRARTQSVESMRSSTPSPRDLLTLPGASLPRREERLNRRRERRISPIPGGTVIGMDVPISSSSPVRTMNQGEGMRRTRSAMTGSNRSGTLPIVQEEGIDERGRRLRRRTLNGAGASGFR